MDPPRTGQSATSISSPFPALRAGYRIRKAFILEGTHMRIMKAAVAVFTLAVFGAMMASSVRAQDDNFYLKRTKVTFHQQIEIPGQFLPAGTYMMELLDSNPNRHIVRFFNADRSKVVATVLAIPNMRLQPSDKAVISFDERPINSPEALKAWFYPGDTFGQEFVYPKRRAVTLAQETKEPVLAFATEPESMTIKEMLTLPLVAETPAREEVAVSEAVEIPPQLIAQALPRTASPIPMIVAMGAAFIGLAFAARRFATHGS
jgi:hypothetical protein